MPGDVVFLKRIFRKNDFARFSNFIRKVRLNQTMTKTDSEDILYLHGVEADGEAGEGRWRYRMWEEYDLWDIGRESRFRTINEPEGIQNLNKEFHVTFLMVMDEKDMREIAQYQELILLMEGYKNAVIYSFIHGGHDFYFKLSQYLSFSIDHLNLRDKIYFLEKDKMIRLQNEALQATGYLPIIIVNRENAERLKQKSKKFLSKDRWMQVLNGSVKNYTEIKGNIEWVEWGGIIRLLLDKKEVISKLPHEAVYEIISDLDVLSVAFFAYFLQAFSDEMDMDAFAGCVEMQQQYAAACHQLLENVLFHSVSGWGIFSIRMHRSEVEKENAYLNAAYSLDKNVSYFEVCISDFSGEKVNQNIAQNFIGRLVQEDRKNFLNLSPVNLFKSELGESDQYENVWKKYYSNAAHGKHVGLRIFQKITQSKEGLFIAESHETHLNQKGDCYGYGVPEEEMEYAMPGTSYRILFPLWKSNSLDRTKLKSDISQEYSDWITTNPQRLLEMETCTYTDKICRYHYESQGEKEKCISDLSDKISGFLAGKSENILSFYAEDIDTDQLEFWVKGLMIAAYKLQGERHFVFFHCTEEFLKMFHALMCEVYRTVFCDMFQQERFQIALLSEEYEQIVYLPGNPELADALNLYYSRIKGIKCGYLLNDKIPEIKVLKAVEEFIPFDVMIKEGEETFFEKYLTSVLEKDIQKEEFGCRINQTHMRLGSTIHINQFYEGELLFSSRYCVSRFAFLMLKDMYKDIEKVDKLTLYGYASYSETLLVTLKHAVLALKKGTDINYIILEREEEHRGMPHADHIRYVIDPSEDQGKHARTAYMQERKYIIVVPINSTLKTHQRLISLLKEDIETVESDQILRNYALILIGPEKSRYWKRETNRKLNCTYGILPMPQYFLSIETEYQESLHCDMCFPANPLHEIPLIEVNAASTIPNQAFGIVRGKKLQKKKLEDIPAFIENEKAALRVLEECMLYGHIQRNDAHYLYYIETEKLVLKAEKDILRSLKLWKNRITIRSNEYHIIVTPNHFSNCHFSEMVNGEVFGGMATILRIDFNKEYRGNSYTKYSNIRQYIRQMKELDNASIIKFHYVDDNIITGKTYFRAKSIVETIVDQYRKQEGDFPVVIFDRVFTLIDRNSKGTRMQYIKSGTCLREVDNYFYFFIRLEISSLRNYGDSCIVCNLYRESQQLHNAAATRVVSEYWEKSSNAKFCITPWAQAVEKRKREEERNREVTAEFKRRSFRRLVCSHIMKYVLDTIGYDNQTVYASKIILKILIEDYRQWKNKEDAFEYFISYLKTVSRPFLVFQKAIKEAIYDILLILIEYIVKEKSLVSIIAEKGKKKYWTKVKNEWKELEELILRDLSWNQKHDMTLVIMKQLTELKSNYLIRLENMNALFDFFHRYLEEIEDGTKKDNVWKDFWTRYVILIKKLTGISSDTSKSVWLDYALLHRKEMKHEKKILPTKHMDAAFGQIILLENTVNFQDGIGKIYNQVRRTTKDWDEKFVPVIKRISRTERNTVVAAKYFDFWKASENQSLLEMDLQQTMDTLLLHLSTHSFFSPETAERAFSNKSKRADILNLAEQRLHTFRCDEDMMEYDALKHKYNEITQGYQFSNFIYLMKEMGWYRQEKETFADDGIIQITGCLIMKYLCGNESDHTMTLLEKIDMIAKVSGWMLGNMPVKMWVEYSDSSEYYKEVIEEKFNQKITAHRKKESGKEPENFEFKMQRHYHIIGDNVGYILALDEEEQGVLSDERIAGQLEQYGYFYEDQNFIWKIGRKSKYPIYLFANIIPDENEKASMIYKIRNLLSLTKDVENCLEGKQNYFHETELAKSKLSMLGRDKSLSHTKASNRNRNFNRIVEGKESHSDDTLVLLADLNVSRVFRQSLDRKFYLESNELGSIKWSCEYNLLKRKSINEGMHGNSLTIELKNEVVLEGDMTLGEGDEFVVIREMEQEFMSLLLAVILNVKEKGRGKEDEKHNICVYISKSKDGKLHILSETECEETVVQRVRRSMEREPVSEESGITMWTLNSYMKKIKVAYAEQIIAKLKENNFDVIENLLNGLTGRAFEINVVITETGGKRYFLYELPVLRTEYEKLLFIN